EHNNIFNIGPNPAYNSVSITSNLNAEEQLKVNIYNEMGVCVFENTINSISTIDLSDIESGMYFIHIQSNTKKHTYKLLIAK
ncbi:MAG: T9SS type A sorting domain-containing protein, partial [Desulfobacterales bacterium]|nr:T9SS type A sorting domain-containing protein [Desulfobacterales bacterium]